MVLQVPQYKPVAALQFFRKVVGNQPLSPPLDESVISSLSDDDFFGTEDGIGFMGRWVGLAQSSNYTGFLPSESQEH